MRIATYNLFVLVGIGRTEKMSDSDGDTTLISTNGERRTNKPLLARALCAPRKRIFLEVVGATDRLDRNTAAQPGLGALASLDGAGPIRRPRLSGGRVWEGY